ncbi:MAG: ABC transporter ATP-binding protein, partial [Planctomycetaceae bacterium]|nr:ABC transporter ATP-binding protein [Planctomycetaceae bacterium]
ADEPTGNLDPATAQTVGDLLLKLAGQLQTALLCVTHSDNLASAFTRTIILKAGRIIDLARPK